MSEQMNEVELSLFTNNMNVYVEISKAFIKKIKEKR